MVFAYGFVRGFVRGVPRWREGAFSFPIKFGRCSVLGKQKKLVSGRQSRGMMTVGEKRVFRRELVRKNGAGGDWGGGGRILV